MVVVKYNPGNKYIKELKLFFGNKIIIFDELGKWDKIPRDFIECIIKRSEYIINTNQINVEELRLSKKSLEQFVKFNNKRLDDGKFIKNVYVDNIINILKKYTMFELDSTTKINVDNTFDYNYVDFKPFDDDYTFNSDLIHIDNDIIYADQNTSFLNGVMRNLFFNKDIVYAFNTNIPHTINYNDATTVKTGDFVITFYNSYFDLPTKYKLICRANTESGECGNIVYFNDSHLFNTLKCTLGTNKTKGHTLTKLDKVNAWESRRVYCYVGKFVSNNTTEDNEDVKDINIYSLTKLDQKTITANFVSINNKGSEPFVLLLATKKDESCITKVPTIINSNTKTFILSDLYNDIKIYYKKNHNITINNKNQIVAHYLILSALSKLYFNYRTIGFVIGASGSGKSFTSKIINNLFSFNHGLIKGTNITQAGFLGGRSSMNNLFGKSLWKPGIVETHDILTIDECTEQLDAFLDENNLNQLNNVFYLLKLIEDGGKRGIMDAEETNPKSCITMFGNLEVLRKNIKTYKDQVNKKYNFYSKGDGKNFNNSWPLFRPIRFYSDTIKNANLAKAHAKVRLEFYNSFHYITHLAEPNQGRIDWMIVLENDIKHYESYEYTGNENITQYHRDQFLEELNKRLKHITHPPPEFAKNVHDFIIKDYFVNDPNNFVTHKYSGVKRQLFNRVVNIMSNMIWLNKYWIGNVCVTVNDEEKDLIRYYLKFNYNTLNEQEASMATLPVTNDLCITYDELDPNDAEIKRDYYTQKQEERLNNTFTLPSSTSINNEPTLPDDEFS